MWVWLVLINTDSVGLGPMNSIKENSFVKSINLVLKIIKFY